LWLCGRHLAGKARARQDDQPQVRSREEKKENNLTVSWQPPLNNFDGLSISLSTDPFGAVSLSRYSRQGYHSAPSSASSVRQQLVAVPHSPDWSLGIGIGDLLGNDSAALPHQCGRLVASYGDPSASLAGRRQFRAPIIPGHGDSLSCRVCLSAGWLHCWHLVSSYQQNSITQAHRELNPGSPPWADRGHTVAATSPPPEREGLSSSISSRSQAAA